MNELQIFNNPEFGEIRAVDIDGEGWFVGNDVAKALGYLKPTDAVSRHVDTEDTMKRGILTMGGEQQMNVINESGVYSLIILSTIPSARKFKKWVTSEVLPSIRKHGTYTMQPLSVAQQLVAQANLMLEMETKLSEVTQRMDTTETLLLDVGAKAEQAVAKLDTAIKVYSTPSKDHWVDDMNTAIKALSSGTTGSEINLRGKLYAELEHTAGHTSIDARLTRLRNRMKKAGHTRKEVNAITKLDAISRDTKLRAIFEAIVKRYQATV